MVLLSIIEKPVLANLFIELGGLSQYPKLMRRVDNLHDMSAQCAYIVDICLS
jgi:hypothetical protein